MDYAARFFASIAVFFIRLAVAVAFGTAVIVVLHSGFEHLNTALAAALQPVHSTIQNPWR